MTIQEEIKKVEEDKCIIKKIKVKSYWKFEGIIPKYIKAHNREICIPKKRIALRKELLKALEEK